VLCRVGGSSRGGIVAWGGLWGVVVVWAGAYPHNSVDDTLALAARAVGLARYLGCLALLLRPKGDAHWEGAIDAAARGCGWRCGCAGTTWRLCDRPLRPFSSPPSAGHHHRCSLCFRCVLGCEASKSALEGIWDAFAECNFWFRNLNKTPLVFLKPSSQVNNFTVFFHFFMGMSKSVFSICLG
jgi:hypothetical protein